MSGFGSGKIVPREQPCRICKSGEGIRVAPVDYWDILYAWLVKCPQCSHIQLDPMLNDEETAEGCLAYYIEESMRTDQRDQEKNCIRNFRRGVTFGISLKRRNIYPGTVLEIGPGSGYFTAGLQFVFPGIAITVMDINAEVLNFNTEHHQYRTLQAVPDQLIAEYNGLFDLVIARDVIEHVSDISKVIANISSYLKPGGHFHFTTPNGREDAWKYHLTWSMTGSPSELLINHVNYFDGKGLGNLLANKGFNPVSYYTYNLKTTLRGIGWRRSPKLMAPVSNKRSAGLMIRDNSNKPASVRLEKERMMDQWYIRRKAKWITYAYSLYQHMAVIRVNPLHNTGHEIYGLFVKSGSEENPGIQGAVAG